MPYSIDRTHPDCSGFAVVKDEDGTVMGCHKSEPEAVDQIQALYAAESDNRDGMFAVIPRDEDMQRLVRDNGESADQLHVTLRYFGKTAADDLQGLSRKTVHEAASWAARDHEPFDVKVAGAAYFGDKRATVLLLEHDNFNSLRDEFCEECDGLFPEETYPHFIPHLTVGYDLPVEDVSEMIGESIRFDRLRVTFGDEVDERYSLISAITEDRSVDCEGENMKENIQNSEEEKPEEVREERLEKDEAIERIVGSPETNVRVSELAKSDKRNLPPEVLQRLSDNDKEVGVIDGAKRGLSEIRFKPVLRFAEDRGSVSLRGYGTVYNHAYDVGGGPPFGFKETMNRGAADRSVSERDDVRLLINHDGVPLARTRSGTLRLESDEIGLYVEVDSLDMSSPLVRTLISAMERGDMDEMSIGFRVLDDEWDERYENRQINELMLYDVSVVTYPANPLAVTSLRNSEDEEVEEVTPEPVTYSLTLAAAEADLDLLDEL